MTAELAIGKLPGRMTRPTMLAMAWLVPAAIIVSYMASPYVALWRLGEALRAHDCATLRTAIDWDRVRDGLRNEIDGAPAPAPHAVATVRPAVAETSDDLPDFGESFASNAVDKALAENVTPEHVSVMLGSAGSGLHASWAELRHALDWAFFSGPRRFDVWVNPSAALHTEAVRLTMAFTRQYGWRVVSVWVPEKLLDPPAPSHST